MENKDPIEAENETNTIAAAIEEERNSHMSRIKAKEAILTLFAEKGELDYIDIMSSLDLDLEMIVDICAELEEEKRIEGTRG